MKKLVLLGSLLLSSVTSYGSQDPLRLTTFTIAPYRCGITRTADIVTVLGTGGQPLAGGGYEFTLSDRVFNQTIIAKPNTDWSAFNSSLAASGAHSLMQWELTDDDDTSLAGTVTLANFGFINNRTQASITLTAPSCSSTGTIKVEVDGAAGPLTFQFFDGTSTQTQTVFGPSPFIHTFTNVPASPPTILYTITILSSNDQCVGQIPPQPPLQFAFPFIGGSVAPPVTDLTDYIEKRYCSNCFSPASS